MRTLEQLAETFVLLLYPFLALTMARGVRPAPPPPRLGAPVPHSRGPLVPDGFLAGTRAMVANALLERPAATLLAAGIVAIGVPVCFAWRSAARRQPAGS